MPSGEDTGNYPTGPRPVTRPGAPAPRSPVARLVARCLAAGLATALAGCTTLGNIAPSAAAVLRFVNAVATPGTLAFEVEQGPAVSLRPGETSGAVSAAAGERRIRLRDGTGTLAADWFTLDAGRGYLVVGIGAPAEPALVLLPEDPGEIAAGDAPVRLVHGAALAGAIDVYLTPGGSLPSRGRPAASGVRFGDVVPLGALRDGGWSLRLTEAGTDLVIYDSGPFVVHGGHPLTLVAAEDPAPRPGNELDLLVVEED